MKIRRRPIEYLFDAFNYTLLTLIVMACVLPVLHVIFASFSHPYELIKHKGLILWPMDFTTKGYELVFRRGDIITGYKNTIIITVVGTALNLLMTSLGAYVLTFSRWGYVKFLMVMIMFTMFFSGGLIPQFLVVQQLGLTNTIWALILPSALSTFNLIVMRTSIMNIPKDLTDSARIDGANDWRILFQIILPLSKAILAVMLLFYAVGHWNSWFPAMIYVGRRRDLYPLQLVLREILITGQDTGSVSVVSGIINYDEINLYKPLVKYTTIVIATLPVMLFYPFIQKHFVKGVMIGSLKG